MNRQGETRVNGKVVFVYPGKFYNDLNPGRFLEIIFGKDHVNDFSFSYVGSDSSTIDEFNNVTNHGAKDYQSTIEIINSCDIGLIFTGGKPFESTTKIFDYIGLEKAILIITNGKVRTGNLHNITSNYPKIYWAENNESAIVSVLEQIKGDKLQVDYQEKHKYSRREGLKKLIEIIQDDT